MHRRIRGRPKRRARDTHGPTLSKRTSISEFASCSTIESTNFCVDYADWSVACNLDSTVTQIDQPGDSGGPWFLSTTAIGIHSGGGAGMSLFTRIGAATDFLDATVLQQ